MNKTAKKRMPNFLVIGAAKSGTTALYYYLRQHPQIYLSPKKEPMFFAHEGKVLNYNGPEEHVKLNRVGTVTTLEDYRQLFQDAKDEIAIGEASTLYLYSHIAPERIKFHLPDVRLIAILRNPVDRAYSGFSHFVRDGIEPLTDFSLALREEEARISENWLSGYHYKQMGYYYAQLKKYFNRFDQNQIKIFLYEDFESNPLDMLQYIFKFLGVEGTFVPDMSLKHNVSGIPKDRVWYDYFLRGQNPVKSILKLFLPADLRMHVKATLIQKNLRSNPPLPSEIRRQLIREYREDIFNLQDLIQRDLSSWLQD